MDEKDYDTSCSDDVCKKFKPTHVLTKDLLPSKHGIKENTKEMLIFN